MTLTSIESKIKTGLHDLKVGAEAVLNAAGVIAKDATVAEPVVNAVLGTIDPGAAVVAETAEAVLAKVIKAVQDAGLAADSKGVNVAFDATVVADIKAIIAAL